MKDCVNNMAEKRDFTLMQHSIYLKAALQKKHLTY